MSEAPPSPEFPLFVEWHVPLSKLPPDIHLGEIRNFRITYPDYPDHVDNFQATFKEIVWKDGVLCAHIVRIGY